MSLLESVRRAYACDVLLTTDGERLLLSGRGELSAELRAALLANKPGIIAALIAFGVGSDDGYGEFEGERAGPKRFATPSGCLAAGACARLGWCERALAGRGCDRTKDAVPALATSDTREAA
jgi:hypothetical protein